MQDRVPLYPGRVKLNPVSGQANTFDLVRADQPTQEGTPLNKASLLKDATAALFGLDENAVPDDVLAQSLSKSVLCQRAAITIGSKSVGSSVFLNVNGVITEFIVVHQGNPDSSMYDASCDGTWLMMKSGYVAMAWAASGVNIYASSDVHSYLNDRFLGLLDTNTQAAIKRVKIPYVEGNGVNGTVASGTNGLATKVFLPSMFELGFTTADTGSPSDGAALEYFADGTDAKRVCSQAYLSRSPFMGYTQYSKAVSEQGKSSSLDVTYTNMFVRPMFVVQSDYVLEAVTAFTDALGNLITIPSAQLDSSVKIATGSYTGTGTYGSSNQNTLTFGFEPKMVFISAGINTSGNCAFVINGQTYFSRTNSSGGGDSADCSFSGNTFTWYSQSSSWESAAQMNSANVEYLYFAIG